MNLKKVLSIAKGLEGQTITLDELNVLMSSLTGYDSVEKWGYIELSEVQQANYLYKGAWIRIEFEGEGLNLQKQLIIKVLRVSKI